MDSPLHPAEQHSQGHLEVRAKRPRLRLGSLLLEPHCGLLWIDFASGDLLHLEARAELVWPEHYPEPPPAGAERQIALIPGRWRLRKSRLPLSFGAAEPSPFLPLQGS